MFGNDCVRIGLMDSGIGGLSVLGEIFCSVPFDTAYYFGDNLNAPYGNRSERELLSLAYGGVSRLKNAGAEIVVLACNTLSASVISSLSELFPGTPFFGVFPPVETAEIREEDYLLLATAGTVRAMKKRQPFISALPLENLAEDIENNIFTPEKIDVSAHLAGVRKNYGKIILGCTHYAFIEREIKACFPRAVFASGNADTAAALNKYINRFARARAYARKIVFLGESAAKNRAVFEKFYKNRKKI